MNQPTTRILWLSDIHFRSEYTGNTKVKDFVDKFIKKIEADFPPESNKIDYIYLGGDMAFSGEEKEYTELQSVVLKPIQKAYRLNKKHTISVPGNHDVEWEKVLAIFHKNKKNLAEKLKKKTEFLADNKDSFFGIFSNYHRTFGDRANSSSYDDHRLFGTHIDEDKKLIFFLFNSSWFSISSKIDDLMKEVKKSITEILLVKKYTNEFGGQIIGQHNEVMNPDGIRKILENEEYKDYVKIVGMHHPLHWLQWEEVYNFESNADFILWEVLKKADLFLTGHEHLPIYVKPKRLEDGAWHIEAGMFLEDNASDNKTTKRAKELFPHNRFSVLEISTNSVVEKRYLYKKGATDAETDWVEMPKHENKLPFKNKQANELSDAEKEEKKKRFYEALSSISNYYQEKGQNLSELSRTHKGECIFISFNEGNTNDKYLFVIPKEAGAGMLKTVFETPATIEYIKKQEGLTHIVFLSFDKISGFEPVSSSLSREEKFKDVVSQADTAFNKFRRKFFDSPNLPLDKFWDVNFINNVIPYWEI